MYIIFRLINVSNIIINIYNFNRIFALSLIINLNPRFKLILLFAIYKL